MLLSCCTVHFHAPIILMLIVRFIIYVIFRSCLIMITISERRGVGDQRLMLFSSVVTASTAEPLTMSGFVLSGHFESQFFVFLLYSSVF